MTEEITPKTINEKRSTKKVAIVCDWLTGTGGAERVVLELHRMFPEAPIYTSQYDASPATWYGDPWFQDADIRTGWLQRLPKGLKKFLPVLRAWWFSRLDLSQYDLVISSSGAEAKGVRTGSNTLHVNYCHAPTHYYWSRYEEYLEHPGFGRLDWLARWGLKLLVGPLRRWDLRAAKQPDIMLANSTHIQALIKKYYKRDAEVVFPPVDTARFKRAGGAPERHGFVIAGRQTPYKRIDLAVEACTQLNIPLIVIGNGPDHKRLLKLGGRGVTFLTKVSDEEIAGHFQSAWAFIFPGVDDFGIVPLEAMAAGTPVVAYKAGGALDYVVPGKTGVFFEKQTVKSLADVLEKFNAERFDPTVLAAKANEFTPAVFQAHIKSVIATAEAATRTS